MIYIFKTRGAEGRLGLGFKNIYHKRYSTLSYGISNAQNAKYILFP